MSKFNIFALKFMFASFLLLGGAYIQLLPFAFGASSTNPFLPTYIATPAIVIFCFYFWMTFCAGLSSKSHFKLYSSQALTTLIGFCFLFFVFLFVTGEHRSTYDTYTAASPATNYLFFLIAPSALISLLSTISSHLNQSPNRNKHFRNLLFAASWLTLFYYLCSPVNL